MRFAIVAALALTPSLLAAQTVTTPVQTEAATTPPSAALDLSYATPIAGYWNYTTGADASEATFSNQTGLSQLLIRCTRATRRVTIARPAVRITPFVTVWSSSLTQSVPASFDPAASRLTIDFAPFDPLLDAIANSRGRIGLVVAGEAPLVVPAVPEIARVIEDCRA